MMPKEMHGVKMKFLGIIALVAVIGFTFAACGGDDDNKILPQTLRYESTDAAGYTYILTVTEDTSRAAYVAVAGDSYVLTIKKAGEPDKVSTGTVTSIAVDGTLTLQPSNPSSATFSVSITAGGQITAITGAITLEGGGTVTAGDFDSGGGNNDNVFTSIAAMETWLAAQPVNTAATAYAVKLNVSDLGGNAGTAGSAGYVLMDNDTKYVSLDLSGSTITSIADNAFSREDSGCKNLTNIIIPNSVISIGRLAFISCTGLTSIIIPGSVTSIEINAFSGTSLTSVTFQGTITSDNLSEYAFHQLGDLRAKYLDATNGGIGTYTTTAPLSNSSVWTKQGGGGSNDNVFTSIAAMATWLAAQPANTAATAYAVKLNVSGLGGSSSDAGSAGAELKTNNTKYVSLDLSGSSFTSIENLAFNLCKSLTGITIGNSVTSIGNGVFGGCTNLASITIPDSVTSISHEFCWGTAWYDNQPDGVVYAGKVALLYKGNMPANTSITLLEGTKGIADEAFTASNLTSITIPASVTNIGNKAFGNYCTGLTSVTFQCTITSDKFNSNAFYDLGNLRDKYLDATNGGIGTYTTTAPVGNSSVWTKQQ